MNLKEVEKLTGSTITAAPTLEGSFYASLDRCESKDGGFLKSCVGFGDTKKAARVALAESMSGKLIIKNAHSIDRQEFNFKTLTIKA